MKRLFSLFIRPTITFILSILAILVIAVSAPGMVQAVLGPAPALSGDVQPGNSIMASSYFEPKVNPAANFGSLTDNGTAAYMGIGISTPVSPLHIYSATSTQPETIDLDGAQPITAQWNDYCSTGGSMSGSGFLGRFARGTKAAPVNVTTGDRLGFNVFGGWVGSWFHTAAIEAIVGLGTVSGSSLPTYMKFSTTPDGSTSRVERMRITTVGHVGIGTTTPTSGQLDAETADGSIAAVYGQNNGSGGRGIAGVSNDGYGVYGTSNGSSGVLGTSSSHAGVEGDSTSGKGVYGYSGSGNGVYGESDTGYAGYFNGYTNVTDNLSVGDNLTVGGYVGIGVASPTHGKLDVETASGNGVYGISNSVTGYGVRGDSSSGTGVSGSSFNGTGVYGVSTNGYGVYGSSTTGSAGYFAGPVTVTGFLTKSGGGFKIDHPQDPENKYLQHSFVESPDMMNVYKGHIILNERGEALVEMPAYFEALNRDFEYQLTAIGAPGPNLYIAEEISGNHFSIAGGKAGMKVSWIVTGVRQDAYANAHPIVVEQDKPANEQGLYLHPIEWGQPKEKGISTALNK